MFGSRSVTEYGIRFHNGEKWYKDKSERDSTLRRVKRSAKKGQEPKAIQRTKKLTLIKKNVKDKCKGGSCKRNGFCTKHAKNISGSEWSLIDKQGRNKNNVRWDEK